MIRPFTCVCMVLACGSGLYLYQAKHRVQLLDHDITTTMHATEAAQARAGVLRAEWTLENDPERLAQLADRFLTLKTVTPGQFTTMAELDKRLPAVRAPEPNPADTTDGDTPSAGLSEPGPGPVPATTVATVEPKPEPPAPPAKREAAAPPPRVAPVKLAVAIPRAQERRPPAPMIAYGETRSAITTVAARVSRPLPAPYVPAPFVPASPMPAATSVLGITRTSIAPPVPFAPFAASNGGG